MGMTSDPSNSISGDPAKVERPDLGAAASVETSLPHFRLLLQFAATAVGFLVVIPLILADKPYWLGVATNIYMLSVGSIGVWVIFAIGRVDLAQGAFAMLGGYATAILSARFGLSFWLCLPLSIGLAAAAGALIGLAIMPLRGVYFAMITLSLGEAMRLAVLNGGDATNGARGFVDLPRAAGLGGPMAFYLLSAALVLVALFAAWRIARSRIGAVFQAMRQSEELASSLGVDVTRYRIYAFAFACGLGGGCGSFFAQFQQNIFPATYSIADSINFLLYCFLGGLDFVLGPVVGAALLIIAFELLNALQTFQALLYGVLMIVLMLFLPNGLMSLRLRRGAALS
jgi:branched-chain amino acid transport system permease protein